MCRFIYLGGCHVALTERSEDSWEEFGSLPLTCGPKVVRIGVKYPDWQGHLASPTWPFLHDMCVYVCFRVGMWESEDFLSHPSPYFFEAGSLS